MPLLAPVFRELNHSRIDELAQRGLSDQSIASIIRDETNPPVKLTASHVNGYLKIQDAAAKQMMISHRTMRALRKQDASKPEPTK